MGNIEISLDDYRKASEGSLLIKRNGKWSTISIEELIRKVNIRNKDINKISNDVENLNRNLKNFDVYAKSHFMVVFNAFKIAILGGALDVTDRKLLDLDEEVILDKVSVEEAVKKHPFIEKLFNELYLKNVAVYKEV